MACIDGLTTARRIRNYDPSARVFIVTDYADEDLRRAALEAGASGYVLKQDIANLAEIVGSL